jgi:predicted PurR-regulated permease PerM
MPAATSTRAPTSAPGTCAAERCAAGCIAARATYTARVTDPSPSGSVPPKVDLLGAALRLLAIGLLVVGVVIVLRPFLPAILWAVIIVVATWPLLLALERRLHGRRTLAVTLMSTGLFAVVVAPISLLLATLITRLPELRDLVLGWLRGPLPAPPAWLAKLPYGERMVAEWQLALARNAEDWANWFAPWAGRGATWLSTHLGTLGGLTLEFLLTLFLVVVLYAHGEPLAVRAQRVARRIGGPRGEESALLAVSAVRAIAMGVVLTALVEALLCGLALWIVGAPAVPLLTAAIFLLCVIQVGPVPVLVPVMAWLFVNDHIALTLFLAAWAVAMSVGEGVARPLLIRRGARMPFLLILAGVFGGLLAFGIAGLFVGPIVLAVMLRLLERWVADGDAA